MTHTDYNGSYYCGVPVMQPNRMAMDQDMFRRSGHPMHNSAFVGVFISSKFYRCAKTH